MGVINRVNLLQQDLSSIDNQIDEVRLLTRRFHRCRATICQREMYHVAHILPKFALKMTCPGWDDFRDYVLPSLYKKKIKIITQHNTTYPKYNGIFMNLTIY